MLGRVSLLSHSLQRSVFSPRSQYIFDNRRFLSELSQDSHPQASTNDHDGSPEHKARVANVINIGSGNVTLNSENIGNTNVASAIQMGPQTKKDGNKTSAVINKVKQAKDAATTKMKVKFK